MNSTIKTVAFWAIIVVSAFLLWQVVKTGTNGQKEKEIGFSEFLTDVDQNNVHEVTFIGQEVKGKLKATANILAVKMGSATARTQLRSQGQRDQKKRPQWTVRPARL